MPILYNNKEILKRSYKRCTKYGISKSRILPDKIFKGEDLITILKNSDELIKIARPFLEILYNILKGSGFSIHLTNKDGVIIAIIGDEDIIESQAQIGIVVGSDLSEKSIGTNSIGTAIVENCSIQFSGEDHYISAYCQWTCSAAVIHNEDGEIIGCVNLTGKRELAHKHTLGLVVAAVRSIENQIKTEKIKNELYNAYQYLNEVMDSIHSGILAVDTKGTVKAINSSLCNILGIRERDILNKKPDDVLSNWEEIFKHLKRGNTYENKETVCLVNGKKKRFNLNVYPIKIRENTIIGMAAVFKDMQNVYDLVNKYTGMLATYTSDDIIGESKEILAVKEKIKMISNSPSTVLIQGESGTGKELIAQAIHNSSTRKNNSFIAINCGAIPENLIESELFGYDEGAFTGGKKGGHPGKFEFANGGTLFLDEIGEMPLDMQVSLLRVLQEGCVTRPGGNKCINVDVRVIASTNKNLKEEVMKGTFREDLYYRLSVIPVYVPPLRERKGDIELLIKHFLKVKAVKLGKPIPELRYDLYEKLLKYSWPGNIREIENCIENIVNMDGNISFNLEEDSEKNAECNYNSGGFDYNMCSLEDWEKRAILSCIAKCNGNITKAADVLGVNRITLYTKLKKYNKGIFTTPFICQYFHQQLQCVHIPLKLAQLLLII